MPAWWITRTLSLSSIFLYVHRVHVAELEPHSIYCCLNVAWWFTCICITHDSAHCPPLPFCIIDNEWYILVLPFFLVINLTNAAATTIPSYPCAAPHGTPRTCDTWCNFASTATIVFPSSSSRLRCCVATMTSHLPVSVFTKMFVLGVIRRGTKPDSREVDKDVGSHIVS